MNETLRVSVQIYTGFLPKICPRLPKSFENPLIVLPSSKIEKNATDLSHWEGTDWDRFSEIIANCLENTKSVFEAVELGAKDRFEVLLFPDDISAELSFLAIQLEKIHKVIMRVEQETENGAKIEGLSAALQTKASVLKEECNSYYRADPSASVRIHKSAPLLANWKNSDLSKNGLARGLHYAMVDAYAVLRSIENKKVENIEGTPLSEKEIRAELSILAEDINSIRNTGREISLFQEENSSDWPFGFFTPAESLPKLEEAYRRML